MIPSICYTNASLPLHSKIREIISSQINEENFQQLYDNVEQISNYVSNRLPPFLIQNDANIEGSYSNDIIHHIDQSQRRKVPFPSSLYNKDSTWNN